MAKKKLRKGMMVQFTNAAIHEECPQWYPEVGTVGTILSISDDGDVVLVQYPRGSTSMNDRWATPASALEVIPVSKNKIIIYTDMDSPRTIIARDLSTGKSGIAKCNPEDEFDFYKGATLAFTRLLDVAKDAPKCKFKVGDKIVGNAKANRYGITKEGWIGTVTKIIENPKKIENPFNADEARYINFAAAANGGRGLEYVLCDDAFDLYDLWNGKVVCTYSFRGCDFIVGKVYKVEDGQIVGENGRKFPSCWTTSDHQHNRLRNAGELDKLEDLFGMKSKFIEYKGEN